MSSGYDPAALLRHLHWDGNPWCPVCGKDSYDCDHAEELVTEGPLEPEIGSGGIQGPPKG